MTIYILLQSPSIRKYWQRLSAFWKKTPRKRTKINAKTDLTNKKTHAEMLKYENDSKTLLLKCRIISLEQQQFIRTYNTVRSTLVNSRCSSTAPTAIVKESVYKTSFRYKCVYRRATQIRRLIFSTTMMCSKIIKLNRLCKTKWDCLTWLFALSRRRWICRKRF